MTQPLPAWLSLATLTNPSGAVTTGLVELPLVFSGPSDVPLGWPYVRAGSGQESSLVSFLEGGPILTVNGGRIVEPGTSPAAASQTAASEPPGTATSATGTAATSGETGATLSPTPGQGFSSVPSPTASSAATGAAPSAIPNSSGGSSVPASISGISSGVSSAPVPGATSSASSLPLGGSSTTLASSASNTPANSGVSGPSSSTGGPTGGFQPPASSNDDSLSGGQIAGIAIGALLGTLLLLLLVFLFFFRRRRRRYRAAPTNSSRDTLGNGWEDLGPAGTGLGATGGSWDRNGGSGEDRYMSESRQGSAMFPTAPTASAGHAAGWGGVAAAGAGLIGGGREMDERRWDPSIEVWREAVPTSPERADALDDGGVETDRSSALEGIYGAVIGFGGRPASRDRDRRPVEPDEEQETMLPYRDHPEDEPQPEGAALASSSARLAPTARAVRPRRSNVSVSGNGSRSSPQNGTSQGSSGLLDRSTSNRSLGLGLPSALAAAIPRRFSRGIIAKGKQPKQSPSPPPRKSSLTSSMASPAAVHAAMFPLPPSPAGAPNLELHDMLTEPNRTDSGGSGSEDVVVFRGYGGGEGTSSAAGRDAALRGRGAVGKRALSSTWRDSGSFQEDRSGGAATSGATRSTGSATDGHRRTAGLGNNSGSAVAGETVSTQSQLIPADEDLFYVRPSPRESSRERGSDSPPDPMYTEWGLAERQVPPEGQTRPYVQSNYPGLRGDGSPRVSPTASRQHLGVFGGPPMARSETGSSYVTSPTSLGAPGGAYAARSASQDSGAWRYSAASVGGMTVASSDQRWSAASSSRPTVTASPRTVSPSEADRKGKGPAVMRKASSRSLSGSEGTVGRSISGILAGLGLGAVFGAQRRTDRGTGSSSSRSSGVPVLRESTSYRTVSLDQVEDPQGHMADVDPDPYELHGTSLERISEIDDEASKRERSSVEAARGREGDEGEAKSESDEEAGETSSLLRPLHPRNSRGTFGQRIVSENDAEVRSQIVSIFEGRSGSSHPSRSSRRSASEHGLSLDPQSRRSTRPTSRGTFGQRVSPAFDRSSRGSREQGSSSNSGSHPSRGTRSSAQRSVSDSGFSHPSGEGSSSTGWRRRRRSPSRRSGQSSSGLGDDPTMMPGGLRATTPSRKS